MTTQQLSTMLSHPDPAVRSYALRHAEQLLARRVEAEPDPACIHQEGAVHRACQHIFPELDLMGPTQWDVYDLPSGRSVAWDLYSRRMAHAILVDPLIDLWYVYHDDLALLLDDPSIPF